MQGLLRQEPLTVDVETSCAHCAQPMRLTLDSDLNYQTKQEGCEPIVFIPDVNAYNLEDPNIIDAF